MKTLIVCLLCLVAGSAFADSNCNDNSAVCTTSSSANSTPTNLSLNSGNDTIFEGHFVAKQKQLGNVIVNGSVDLTQVIMQSLLLNGKANLNQVTMAYLTVNGDITIAQSSITGNAQIHGKLTASDSKLNQLTIASNEVELSNCTVGNILINVTQPGKKQSLSLTKTLATGTITFPSGKGVIYLSKDSKITGKVIGARIVDEK